MPSKRYSVEQIIAKLREMEKLQGQGVSIVQGCKRLGISDQTYFRWRQRYGALKEDEAHRLKALEQENARLKKIIAEQALDIRLSDGANRVLMAICHAAAPSVSTRLSIDGTPRDSSNRVCPCPSPCGLQQVTIVRIVR